MAEESSAISNGRPRGQTAFGSPDAATDTSPRPPFELTGLSAYAGMSTPGGDPFARVLVGRMGAGKTRCLLELRERMNAEGRCELAPIEYDLPNLRLVTQLAEDLAGSPAARAEVWRNLWDAAITESVLSRVGGESKPPRSIYSEFTRILGEHNTLSALNDFLGSPARSLRRQELHDLLTSRQQPLCYFLDAVEEDSAAAPLYWLWCQSGLVTQVLRYATNAQFTEKLRIFVAIREQTWAQLRRTESPARVDMHPHVRLLRWDARLIAEFLGLKVKGLSEDFIITRASTNAEPRMAVAAWMGTTIVKNEARNINEDITQYILRHTRLIPRDIVTVGNFLARETLAAKQRSEQRVSDERIRMAVAESARLAAGEELQWCGREILSHQLAESHGLHERRELVQDEDAAFRTTDALKDLLAGCVSDVLESSRLRTLDREAEEKFKAPVAVGAMLWKHGLIGWGTCEQGPFIFSLRATHTSAEAPPGGSYIAFHPILIDGLGLEPVGELPILPFASEELP